MPKQSRWNCSRSEIPLLKDAGGPRVSRAPKTHRGSRVSTSSSWEMLLGKGVLKICSKFTGEHLCRSVISIKLLSNFIKITLRHGCFSVNLLHFFRTPEHIFYKNTSGGLLLIITMLIADLRKFNFCRDHSNLGHPIQWSFIHSQF